MVGFPERADDVYNAAAVLADGRVAAVYRKVYLPNYSVFDEQRYFQSGPGGALIELNGVPIGITICEDIWEPGPPATDEALAGRAGDRQPVRLALPRRQGPRARGDARPARARQQRRGAVLQPRRRPGRAGLRRPQRGHRPGGRDRGPRAPVRGVDHGLHDRPRRDRRQAPAGRAPPGCGAPRRRRSPPPRWRALELPGSAEGEVGGEVAELLAPEEELYARARHRACATTSRRTASSAWWWRCPAGSTRRWSRSWRSTRSARSA